MKQKLFTYLAKSYFMLMVLAASCFNPSHAAVITVSPSSSIIDVGDKVTLSISLNDLTDLYAYQLDLLFNSNVLHIDSIESGSLFSSGSVGFSPGVIDNDVGTLSFVFDSLSGPVAGVNGAGTIALISFTSVGAGLSSIDLANVTLLNSSLATIDLLDVVSAQVNVTSPVSVPEPATYALFGLGLLGIGTLRRGKLRHKGNMHDGGFLSSPVWS